MLGQVGLARLGQRLHPLGQADRVADRRVVAVARPSPIAPATTSPELIPIRAEKLRPSARGAARPRTGDVVEHPQRRVAGALRVVLVGDRRPEDGHDPVAGELVDGALEAVDRLGEDREEALHDRAPLLGVVLLGEVHRALHVGEQHRHLLALSASSLPISITTGQGYAGVPACAVVKSAVGPVTGASTGIGRATALRLDAAGWRVFAGVRREADAEALREAGSERLVPADARRHRPGADRRRGGADRREHRTAAASTGSSTTPASMVPGPLETLPIEDFRRQIEINLTGQVAVTQAMLPQIRRRAAASSSSARSAAGSPFR